MWVLGCATGEEAYSIAILLREHMARLDAPPSVQIFATDIDGKALAAARVGRYRTNIENDMSAERLARWDRRLNPSIATDIASGPADGGARRNSWC